MARYAYDVNTRTRLIDVHKQFNRGLKTVDTDDALGAVFLRQAENVSLSEFGFIEKRYGTFENFKKSGLSATDKFQGYWEFEGFGIMALNNKFYYFDLSTISASRTIVNSITQENADYRYPTTPPYNGLTDGFGGTEYREMNAVAINSVLYIFTGYYPVYVKIVNSVPTFYWFSVDIPTYDEIVVTGHNLLEDDFDGLYHTQSFPFTGSFTTYNSGIDYPKIIESATSPRFPSVKDNDLKFYFRTQYPTDMNAWITTSSQNFFEIKLDSVQFRDSSPGASDTSFTEIDPENIDFEPKNNYSGSSDFASRGEELIQNGAVTKTKYSRDTPTSSQYRYNFQIYLDFEIERNAFTSKNKFLLELFKFNGVENLPFYLQDYGSGYNVTYTTGIPSRTITQLFADLKITPVDFNGKILKKQSITLNLRDNSGSYSFSPPEALNKGTDIAKYLFELKLIEKALVSQSNTLQESLNDLQTNPENYTFTLSDTETKSAPGSGNLITSNSVPTLSFTVSDIISGTFDFKVRFLREEWKPITINGSFERVDLVQKEFFETIVSEVTILPEQFQDYPGVTDDFLPEEKPIWTCNKVIEHFGKLLVWGSKEMPTAIFYSFPDRPTYFPSKFYLDFTNDNNAAIEAVTPFMNILVAQTNEQTWGIRGNSGLLTAPAPYTPFTINSTVGTIAYKSVRPVRNHLFFLSKQGVIALKSLYAADEQYNIEFVDRNIRNIVPQDSDAVGIQFDNQYWLNFPNNSITLRWYIDKKAWVKDVYHGFEANGFKGVFKYQIKDGKLEFLTYPSVELGDSTYSIFKIGVDNTLPTDLTEGIDSKIETSFLNQNYPFHPKNYKESKLDFTLQNEYNQAQGSVYNMAVDEDFLSPSVHSVDNVDVLPNHYYRLKYDFSSHEAPIVDGGSFASVDSNIVEGGVGAHGVFGTAPTDILTGFIGVLNDPFADLEVTSVSVRAYNDPNVSVDVNNLVIDGGTVTFQVPNTILNNQIDIEINGDFNNYTNGADITDITYDDSLTLKAWVISEDKTLNLDNIDSYDQAKADVKFNFNTRLGTWVFGSSDFGNKVTGVKTIKLSGKGYNAKLYMEDFSKSKWTLESIGLTYKMKRARSR